MGWRRWRKTRRRQQLLTVQAPSLTDNHVKNCTVVIDRLSLLDHLPKHAVVAEVGVLHGDFSQEILDRTSPSELHLIDVRDRWYGRFAACGDQVHSHIGDSVEVLSTFPDEHFDWIYIDADHSYDMVKRDTELAKSKVKHNGALVFNDYMTYDAISDVPYGVAKTVHELCLDDGWEMSHLALHSASFYDVAVRRLA